MAGGRRPNTDGLDLDMAGIALRDDGSITVDDRLRTSAPGVWAIGDVNGEQPFTRVCQEEAKVAFADAFDGSDVRIDRRSLGHGIFTDPEIGSVGLTESAARAAGRDGRAHYEYLVSVCSSVIRSPCRTEHSGTPYIRASSVGRAS